VSLTETVRAALGPGPVGVAVSGGGDSVALLVLAVRAGVAVEAATVDHGFRPEAAAEAAAVAALCTRLGVAHQTLRWTWDGRGNRMEAAREGRMAALAAWAGARGLPAVALAHTRDDVAETFLMRLARRSGVDGLAAMAARRAAAGTVWLRPLLSVGRADLRAWLRAEGIAWADDPTNDDPAHGRTQARAALAALAPLGITAAGLAEVAGHLRAAREALHAATVAAGARVFRAEAGALAVDRAALAAEPEEIRRRLLDAAFRWIGGGPHGPRRADLARAAAALAGGRAATLHGVRVLPSGWLVREGRAVGGPAPVGALWDGRWRIEGPPGEVRALGAAAPRVAGVPRVALAALPGVWEGDRLLASPALDPGPWTARIARDLFATGGGD
jgi:tRNA(Ile)-lysidine synthase